MQEEQLPSETSHHLSHISTLWTQLVESHQDEELDGVRQSLLLRYRNAVRRYLFGAIKDIDLADELFHEFSIRFLKGDFRRATPERGRFRDYIRKVLINLVNEHHRQHGKQPAQLDADIDVSVEASIDEDFDHCVRDELMSRTWEKLKTVNQTYHDVLWLRVTEPDLSSRDMAEQLTLTGTSMTSAGVRKTVERARARFSKLFTDEVMDFVEFDSTTELYAELKRLNLTQFCGEELALRGVADQT